MDYRHKNRSKYGLKVQLIFVCKYRKKLLHNDIEIFIKQQMLDISKRYDCNILEMETDEDHIHILLEYPITISVFEITKNLKQISTYNVWEKFPIFLSKHFWKEHTFWSDGYFASSIGEVSQETIKKYIQNQG